GVTWEIIVVDNNSTDATGDVVEGFIRTAILPLWYCYEEKQGAAYARNRGVHAARGKILGFVDDDETLNSEWLAAVNAAFDRYGCAGVGGRVLPRWMNPPPAWYTTEGRYRIIGPIQDHDLGDVIKEYTIDSPMPLGGNLAVRRECFDKYGPFRTDLGPVRNEEYAMGEDTEFCLRLLQRGERLVYIPTAVTFNLVHPERLSKKFCRSFYFRLGRSVALLRGLGTGSPRIIGVPRHLFRSLAKLAAAWAGSVLRGNGPARLYFGFQLAYVAGEVYHHLYMRSRRGAREDSAAYPFSTRRN
ncbi:MAG: glycosyltransferase, partial [Methylococcales bacterium]